MKLIHFIILCLLQTGFTFGQKTISGKIIDLSTGKGICCASIIEFGTVYGTKSDSLGNFFYQSKKKSFILFVSHAGYKKSEIEINRSSKDVF